MNMREWRRHFDSAVNSGLRDPQMDSNYGGGRPDADEGLEVFMT